ncbi:MAG: sulfatase-like hydrolase/transferase, partial [Spirochaetales bacterium]|nr:sulfatase-like hydrolase/transferase [Spirochaetales bacterium]
FISDHVVAGKHSSELFCEATADFIDQYENSTPFFTYTSLMAPHDPRSMPKEFRDMYNPSELPLPENFMALHPVEYGNTDCRDELLAPYPRTPDVVRRHLADYYGMISHLDHQMGLVIEALERKGVLENTLILFAGDNGLALGQHGLFGKQSTYEHSVRVPFIISGPGVPVGEKRDAYIYLLDIYPTLCDLIGIGAPESVEGISFKPILDNKDERTRETLYFAYTDKIRAVKDDRYKLMEFVHNGNRTSLLFDLRKDPAELANLIGTEGMADTAAELRKELFRFRDEWDDERHPLGKEYWTGFRASV